MVFDRVGIPPPEKSPLSGETQSEFSVFFQKTEISMAGFSWNLRYSQSKDELQGRHGAGPGKHHLNPSTREEL